jgi:hypothetical protein
MERGEKLSILLTIIESLARIIQLPEFLAVLGTTIAPTLAKIVGQYLKKREPSGPTKITIESNSGNLLTIDLLHDMSDDKARETVQRLHDLAS